MLEEPARSFAAITSFASANICRVIACIATLCLNNTPHMAAASTHHLICKRPDLPASSPAFKSGKADILLATSIVEIGIDIPNANTLIVD